MKTKNSFLTVLLLLSVVGASMFFTLPVNTELDDDLYPDEWLDFFGIAEHAMDPSDTHAVDLVSLPSSDPLVDGRCFQYHTIDECYLHSITSGLAASVILRC